MGGMIIERELWNKGIRALLTLIILLWVWITNPFCAAAEGDIRPKSSARTNPPPWKANMSLVAVRGIIWNEKISANEPLQVTLVVKNVSKGDVFALKKFNCNNYMFETGQGMMASHGDGAAASSDEDFIRLKPGEVTTFSTFFGIAEAEAKEGRFTVNFHNNMDLETVKTPTRAGIPVINHLEYDFGRIKVYSSKESVPQTGGSRSTQPTNSNVPRGKI